MQIPAIPLTGGQRRRVFSESETQSVVRRMGVGRSRTIPCIMWSDVDSTALRRVLGIDDAGREILSFIPGFVPPELGYFTVSAQVTFAGRLTLDGVREWSHDCRAWVQRNRDKLSSAIAFERPKPPFNLTGAKGAPAG